MRKLHFSLLNAFNLLAALAIQACAHHSAILATGPGLFPYARYQHEIKITVLEPPRTMEMKGVVAYTESELKVIGLSAFNATVFRIEENRRTGEIKKHFYLDVLKRNEKHVDSLYQLIRQLMTAPKNKNEFQIDGASFTLSAPDTLGVPRQIHIQKDQIVLDITVTSYE